jgi:hypothetical protein
MKQWLYVFTDTKKKKKMNDCDCCAKHWSDWFCKVTDKKKMNTTRIAVMNNGLNAHDTFEMIKHRKIRIY